MFLSFSRLVPYFFVYLFLLSFLPVAFAQEIGWRSVSPAELAITAPSVEPDADAEAIFWEVRLDDKKVGKLAYDHYVRVKIFTERGREKFSKFDIPFTKGKKVEDVQARVIKPDGSTVDLKPEDIFEREIARAYGLKVKAKSFAIPGIETGVIVEYRYKETFKGDSANNERLIFQRDVPAQRISYYVRPYKGMILRSQQFNMPTDSGFAKDSDGFFVMTMQNVKAYKEEPRMPPQDQVRSWSLLTYATGFISNNTWSDYANSLSYGMAEILKANDDVKRTAAELTAGAASQDEKLKRIYDFCQKQIKNAVFDPSITDEQRENIKNKSAGDTLKRKVGGSGHIDILFGALAKAAGFDVRLSLSGDRSEYFFNPNKDTHISFVHPATVAVRVNGSWKYFNPATPFLAYGELLWHEEMVSTIDIGEGTYDLGSTPLSGAQKNLAKREGKFKLSEEGTLEGEVKIEFYGHFAINRRFGGHDSSEQKRLDSFNEEIKEDMSAAEITGTTYENFNDNSKPLVFRYKIKVPNYAQKTGKRLFLKPGFFEYGKKPEFSSSTRVHPIYFRFPWSEEDKVEIELPSGYAVEAADQPKNVMDSGKMSNLEAAVMTQAGPDSAKLKYERKFYFGEGGKLYFPQQNYIGLKKLFDLFYQSDQHTITLKQK